MLGTKSDRNAAVLSSPVVVHCFKLKADPLLCFVCMLRSYLQRTTDTALLCTVSIEDANGQVAPAQRTPLYCNLTKKDMGKPIKVASIRAVANRFLSSSCEFGQNFTIHDFRGAVATMAEAAGAPRRLVMSHLLSTDENTYLKHYCRPMNRTYTLSPIAALNFAHWVRAGYLAQLS